MRAEDITIIVPTRNEMRNIPAFLGSIPPDISLIVVDASSDDTTRCIAVEHPHTTWTKAHSATGLMNRILP